MGLPYKAWRPVALASPVSYGTAYSDAALDYGLFKVKKLTLDPCDFQISKETE